MRSTTLSVYVDAPLAELYAYASNPINLPAWVPSFFKSIEFVAGKWLAQTPAGQVVFTFVDTNPYGVLDHTITLPSGVQITNPMRVIANGRGSEIIFTLMQQPEMSDADFEVDIAAVNSDLATLKRIVEGKVAEG